MPIFEYTCKKCNHAFEQLVFKRDARVDCPECGSGQTQKLLSGFAITGTARLSGGSSCGSCKPSAGKCSGCGGH